MISYTLRPDTFTLIFNFTLSGTYQLYFTYTGQSRTDAKPAKDMKKLKPEMAANPVRVQGLGIWEFDDLSDEEDEDWRSEDEDDFSDSDMGSESGSGSGSGSEDGAGASRQTGTKGGKSGKKDAKRQLKFHEFWQIPTLLAAAGQSESVCLDVLKCIADRSTDDAVEGEGSSVEASTLSAGASAVASARASSFEEISDLTKAVADVLSTRGVGGGGGGGGGGATPIPRRTRSSSKLENESKAAAVSSVVSGGDDGEEGDAENGEEDGEWDREAEEDTKVLLNLLYAPRRSRLHSLAKTLCRLENLSHILAWTSCPADGPLPGGRAGSDNGDDTGYHARREAHMLSKGGTRARQYDMNYSV